MAIFVAMGGLSRCSWSPAISGPPGPSTAIFVAVDGPPETIMAATNVYFAASGPPVFFRPTIFTHCYRELTSKNSKMT